MKIDPFLFGPRWPVFAPEDEGAGGNDGSSGDGAGGEGAGGEEGTGQGDGGDEGSGGGTQWWKDDRFEGGARDQLEALGLTVDDPIDAIVSLAKMESSAKRKLKADPDSLFSKPAKDQDVAEWRKANAEAFGVPETAEGYELTKPENLPQGVTWDEGLEAKARQLAHDRGWSSGDLQAVTDFYAEHMGGMYQSVADELENSTAQMWEELERDWGDQTKANETRAKQAATLMAEELKFDSTAMAQLTGALSRKTGDANVMRFFAKIGELMGEDNLIPGGGAGGIATTPAEARAELARLRGPDGEYAQAVASRNRAKISELKPKIERLTKIANGQA